MGKAKIKKKESGYHKQLEKHIDKFKEAEQRGDIGAMNYYGKELKELMRKKEIFTKRLKPKK
tara:strand:- start:1178 stop:1363 length:186 start_codon:yes stop_codon:yes gene_type:complete